MLMRWRTSRRGLGWLFGSGCFCDSAFAKFGSSDNMMAACWTMFPCTSASDMNPMSNVGTAASSDTIAALQDAWAATDSSCDANPLGPGCSGATCTSTIITSPFAVCDWIIYAALAIGGLVLFQAVRR